jgi:hypothetical protein
MTLEDLLKDAEWRRRWHNRLGRGEHETEGRFYQRLESRLQSSVSPKQRADIDGQLIDRITGKTEQGYTPSPKQSQEADVSAALASPSTEKIQDAGSLGNSVSGNAENQSTPTGLHPRCGCTLSIEDGSRVYVCLHHMMDVASASPDALSSVSPESDVCVCGHDANAHGNDGTGHCGATRECRAGKCKQFQAAVSEHTVSLSPEWQPIATAPNDGSAFRAYGPSLIDPDFNPWGSVEACFDGERFVGAVWNGQHDIWNTLPIEATHWQPIPASPVVRPEGFRQELEMPFTRGHSLCFSVGSGLPRRNNGDD